MRTGSFGSVVAVLLSVAAVGAQPVPDAGMPAVPPPVAVPSGPFGPAEALAPPYVPPPEEARTFWPSQPGDAFPLPLWARAEHLQWLFKEGPTTPPLVTTGPAGAARPAVLGAPGTTVLFGGNDYDYGRISGGRYSLGGWFDCDEHLGGEITGLATWESDHNFGAFSNAVGAPVLGLPFRDAVTGTALVDFVSFPGRFAGGITVSWHSRLWGLEGNLLSNYVHQEIHLGDDACPLGDLRLDLLAGFRHADLLEGLDVAQGSVVLPGGSTDFEGKPVPVGRILVISDGFGARSQFFGGQVGGRAEFVRGCFFLDVLAKVALGDSHEIVQVSGNTLLAHSAVPPNCSLPVAVGCPLFAPGGFLATSTNIGRVHRDTFTVLPEFGVNVGYQVCPLLRVFAGYTFLYWSSVVRPQDQVDTTVNLTRVPTSATFGAPAGPARPALPFRETDFWAQGVNFGLEFRF
jgi:hypothetical protein